MRFAPAQLSRDHLDQRFTGFGHAATQDNQSRVNGLGQNLDSVADGAHYHVQHIDGLGLPLFRATNQVGHRRVGVGPQTSHGCARADGFQASVLPARALEAMRFDWDMADFAGRAAIAMHQHAVFDDARSQSGAEVQERNGTGHAVRTAQYGGRADGGGIDVVFHMGRHARTLRDQRPHIQRDHVEIHDIAHMPAGRIHRARGTDTDGPHLVKTLTRRLMRYSDDVFDHGIVAMSGGNTGGTQYRAHCVNQHSFDFCSAHVNTDFEIVHSVFRHQSSPVLHRTFRLISVCIRLLTTILTNYPKTTLTCTTHRMTY